MMYVVYACIHMCIYLKRPERDFGCPLPVYNSTTYFLETGSFTLVFCQPDGQPAPIIFLSPTISQGQGYRCGPLSGFSHGCQGSKLKSLCYAANALYPLSHLLSPTHPVTQSDRLQTVGVKINLLSSMQELMLMSQLLIWKKVYRTGHRGDGSAVLPALPDGLSLVAGTYIRWLTATLTQASG